MKTIPRYPFIFASCENKKNALDYSRAFNINHAAVYQAFFANRRRAATATKPNPISAIVVGSGTGATVAQPGLAPAVSSEPVTLAVP